MVQSVFLRRVSSAIALALFFSVSASAATNVYPGVSWNDIYGNAIHSHGGSIYFENGFYHWVGTNEATSPTTRGIHLYRSRDLVNWNDFGIVLRVAGANSGSDIASGSRLVRPKLVKNTATGEYNLFFGLFLRGQGLAKGYVGRATSNSPTGPFTYRGKWLGASSAGTGDSAFFKDPRSNNLYHFTVRKTDRAFVRVLMKPDYSGPSGNYTRVGGILTSTEAPAIFYKSGTYHMLSSASWGWAPTPPRYYTTRNITGSWTQRANPLSGFNPNESEGGANRTFGGQSTYIQPIYSMRPPYEQLENQYIAMFDVWEPRNSQSSKYIWLPFRVRNAQIDIDWTNRWNLRWFDSH